MCWTKVLKVVWISSILWTKLLDTQKCLKNTQCSCTPKSCNTQRPTDIYENYFWIPRHVQSTIIGNTIASLFNISYLKVATYMRSPWTDQEKITQYPHLCTDGGISSDGYCIQAATTRVTAQIHLIECSHCADRDNCDSNFGQFQEL